MNPYMNNQFYMQDLQSMRDRIDTQMKQMQQLQQAQQAQHQQPAPTNLTQTFQLAPQQSTSELDGKYVSNVDEVKNTLTIKNTLFVTKDMSTLWLKDVSGNIKAYALTEIIETDEKDRQIQELQKQIEELKGVVLNAQHNDDNTTQPIESKKSQPVQSNRAGKKQ